LLLFSFTKCPATEVQIDTTMITLAAREKEVEAHAVTTEIETDLAAAALEIKCLA